MRIASIQTKLFALVFSVAVVLVGGLTAFFVAANVASAERTLEHKAESYAHVLGRELEPALAFDDLASAREDFDAVATDPDVRALALLDRSGHVLYQYGEFRAALEKSSTSVRLAGAVQRSAPVVAREGARGTVVVELATTAVLVERARALRIAALVDGLATALGLAGAWLIARSIGRRLGAIAAATQAVASGDLSQPMLRDDSPDELGRLSRSFAAMVEEIRNLLERLRLQAGDEQQRLTQLVGERTKELTEKHTELRLVLDTIGDGFVLLDREGRMGDARAAVVTTWFGEAAAGARIWDYLAPSDANAAAWFELGFGALMRDELPVELAVEQMPKSIQRGDQRFAVRYKPVLIEGRPDGLVCAINDVTREVESARLESEQREMLGLFQRALTDRGGVLAFLDEASLLAEGLREEPPPSSVIVLRAVHTLKGNAGLFGLSSVAGACHELEARIEEGDPDRTRSARDALVSLWASKSARLRELLGVGSSRLEIDSEQIDGIREALRRGKERAEVLALVEALALEPAARRLQRFVEPAQALALRLGKPAPVILVEGEIALDRDRLGPFWTAMAHVVRNAVDHGIEAAEDRIALGKPARGNLSLRAFSERGSTVVTVEDDGRGITWSAIADLARAAGLPAASAEDLEAALFSDGLSTRSSADDISGRGVGLAALRATVTDLGGSVRVRSKTGQGTSFEVRLPPARRSSKQTGWGTSIATS